MLTSFMSEEVLFILACVIVCLACLLFGGIFGTLALGSMRNGDGTAFLASSMIGGLILFGAPAWLSVWPALGIRRPKLARRTPELPFRKRRLWMNRVTS